MGEGQLAFAIATSALHWHTVLFSMPIGQCGVMRR